MARAGRRRQGRVRPRARARLGHPFGDQSRGRRRAHAVLLSTWAAFGVDGNGDDRKDVYDPADAIPGAARYLKHNGAPEKIRTALFAYNRSDAYVEKVLRQAAVYAEAGSADAAGEQACLGAGGTVAPPTEAAAEALAFARAQLGKPYVWGAEGPGAFDCSGLTYAAYRAAAITIPRVSGDQWRHGHRVPRGREQPGDLVFFDSGPGSSRSNPGHVGLVIAPGKMIAAPHSGTVVQIQSYERDTLLGFTRPTAHR
ncbi:hypothetical protein GCM10010182_00070 [Actinomadura cremea]|nr:hypothetical protein GCM10010182_00070 [Actinomadura cremea]